MGMAKGGCNELKDTQSPRINSEGRESDTDEKEWEGEWTKREKGEREREKEKEWREGEWKDS